MGKRVKKKNKAPQIEKKKNHRYGRVSKNRRPVFMVVGLIFLLIAIAAGTWFFLLKKGTSVHAGDYRDFNLLVITLDTLRADHLPAYGYTKVKTPHLDRLASQSFVFEDAVSHAPLTLPSHTSIFTGLLPIAHGIRDNAGFFLDDRETTLAEILKENGYATSAFVSAFVLDSRWKLDQGFDNYFDNFNLEEFKKLNPQEAQRTAGETEAEVSNWLEDHKDERFFCWVHFYDPHDPYDPPEPYKTEYGVQPYDGEIAYTDEIVGKLLERLESLNLRENTIIILTGDHGESLGEHQEMTHAMFVYNATQHVPLFITVPGAGGHRVRDVARHIDLYPTILELMGIQAPETLQGTSLLPIMNGKTDPRRAAYSESIYAELHYGWSPIRSITTSDYKYIDVPRAELYDRKQDPEELRNLIEEKPMIAKVLKDQLLELIDRMQRADLQGPAQMDPETEEKLRALGYIGGTVESTPESRQIDPKDKIHLAKAIHLAFRDAQAREYEEAVNRLTPVLQEDPNMTDAHFVSGVSYVGLKEYDKAIDSFLKTLALRPDHTMALYNLGYTYEEMGNVPEAISWYLKVLDHEPEHLQTNMKLGHIFLRTNQPDKSKLYFQKVILPYEQFLKQTRSDRGRSALHSTLGEIHFGAGHLDEAERHFHSAIELTPDRDSLHYNLAQIYEAEQHFPQAVAAYRKEIDIDPLSYKAYNDLGILYRRLHQYDLAASCFRKVVELIPDDPRGYYLLASVYRELGRNEEALQILRNKPEG